MPNTMPFFRRLALLLALGLPAMYAAQAHAQAPDSSSSSSSQPQGQAQAQPSQPAAAQGQESVQSRIRVRREQRRAAAIHEVYSHLYEAYVGAGYMRFVLPSPLQKVNQYNWDAGFTRYYSERFGVTLDGRGIYGTAYVYNNGSNVFRPAIAEYAVMLGPTYRFYLKPRYSIAGRVMGGFLMGDFSGDANGVPTTQTHLYSDGYTYGVSAALMGEYNLTPAVGLRVAPEYFASGFGSTLESNYGFTASIVYRFGKQ
jgi:hypothetical protein